MNIVCMHELKLEPFVFFSLLFTRFFKKKIEDIFWKNPCPANYWNPEVLKSPADEQRA